MVSLFMFNNLKMQIRKVNDLSIFIKLSIIWSIAMTISILFISYYIMLNFSAILQEKQITLEKNVLKRLYNFTNEKYENIINLSFDMHSETSIGYLFSIFNDNPKEGLSPFFLNKIYNYLKTYIKINNDIEDIILITKDYTIFHQSTKSGRSISVLYNFKNDDFLKKLNESDNDIIVNSDKPDRYIIDGSERVISFIGNIFNPQKLPLKKK